MDLNTASQADLETVKGIGPAKAIIEYRKKNGNFKSVDDLDNVPGFGKKSVDKMKKDIRVGNATAAAGKPASAGFFIGLKLCPPHASTPKSGNAR